MMKRRTFTLGLAGAAASTLGACASYHSAAPVTRFGEVARGYRPAPDTDEAGMWLRADKAEQELRNAPIRVRDKAVNDLLTDMMCRLSGDRCPDLRVYVVRTPIFNAFAMPNGCIQVYTGLLLRCRSESQVATILGHEYGHYLRRHSLQRTQDDRFWRYWAELMALSEGPSDMDGFRRRLVVIRRMYFSRENERDADDISFHRLVAAGYDPRAAAAVWEQLIDEDKAAGTEEKFDFYSSTHPLSAERMNTLNKLADEAGEPKRAVPDRLAAAIAPIRAMLMTDELNLGHFKQTELVFNRQLEIGHDVGEVLFYKGELYRRRAKEGDETLALGFYHEACEAPGAPPEAFRSVGLMRWRRGEKDMAREYFRRYLAVNPAAGDGEMIKNYLTGA